MKKTFKSFTQSIKDPKGATAVEYAVLLALISAVILVSVGLLGVSTRDAFDTFNTEMSNLGDENKCGDKDSPDDNDCGIGNDQ